MIENKTTRIEARHRLYEGFGEKHTAAQWAKLLGLPRTTLWRYLHACMGIEEVARLRHIDYPRE